MSFLAQLRQQNAAPNPTGLQLCYLLSADEEHQLRVGLYLAALVQGALGGDKHAYCIQRQHLVMPPPFLTPADGAVLTQLVEQSEHWLEGGEHPLAVREVTPAGSSLLRDMVSTGKCFAQREPGVWHKVRLGQHLIIEPFWRIGSTGTQGVGWRVADLHSRGAVHLWQSGKQYWGYAAERGELMPTQATLDTQAMGLLREQAVLPPQQVDSFLQADARQWQQYGLPLPQPLPQVTLAAQVHPVLTFCGGSDEQGRRSDVLVFGFRYTSEKVCIERRAADESTHEFLWSGSELLSLPLHRAQEQHWRQKLSGFVESFTVAPRADVWASSDAGLWRHLLLEDRRQLQALGFTLVFEPSFKHRYIAPERWQVELQQTGQEWHMALNFTADGHTVNVLDLLKQLRAFNQDLAKDQIEVAMDGRILVLSGELIGSLAEELADLLELYKSKASFPLNQLYRIDGLKQHLPESTHWLGGEALQEQALSLRRSPVMLDRNSCDVRAELRPYQWLGVCWLQHLAAQPFNGLLADDMGLGKTLQTLAHLSLEQKKGRLHKPALIIAPTSLLSNWQNELQRFCPQLRCHLLHGANRHQWWQNNQQCDVLITSYHLIVRDLETWQTVPLSWLILDEAQVIKNPRTQISQAVRELQAEHRLCLSGTPVENHLGELWSLLDFLEPGVLGSQRQFAQYYQKPIEQNGVDARLQQLLARVAPFMLRRTKAQVAKDLPPKTVMLQSIAFDEKQQAYYQQLKTEGWQALTEQLNDAENAGQKQFLLLTALTKLRQACCDPRLLDEASVPSAKTEYCLQMVEELTAENRAVLVFSQFTSMLDILARELKKRKLPHLMLTGKSKNRGELVEAFQRGDAPVFLISLKAGGVGLNLTRADTVIHFDPWWNSAAEDQAADRAHRIGQTQPVFVYKLIAKNTVEEKIARLQQAKAQISAQVNNKAQSTGESFALKLEDLLALWQQEDETW